MNRKILGASLLLSIGICVQAVKPTAEDEYLSDKGKDPISAMQARIYTGDLKLAYEPKQGFLRAILKELKISPSSQILVFSKTSLQTSFISPTTPRALYFNDRTYVGWIKDAPYIEIASVDPNRGPIFYLVRNVPQPRPTFSRKTYECLGCHESSMTRNIPGLTARSVFVGQDGQPRLANGSFITTYQSPMKERWGGWYVTGTQGSQRHMGNEIAHGDEMSSTIDVENGANVKDLRPYIDTDSYLTPYSDIVALMVAEHQMDVQNLITKASFLTKDALRDESIFSPEVALTGKHTASTLGRIEHACEPLVESLLCVDEAKLTDQIVGSGRFAAEFSSSAPKDRIGRSLSELDLKTRLLRYRCSPMVYSASFDGLPFECKNQVFRRLDAILSSASPSKPFDSLGKADREAIHQILADTLPEFARAARQPR